MPMTNYMYYSRFCLHQKGGYLIQKANERVTTF